MHMACTCLPACLLYFQTFSAHGCFSSMPPSRLLSSPPHQQTEEDISLPPLYHEHHQEDRQIRTGTDICDETFGGAVGQNRAQYCHAARFFLGIVQLLHCIFKTLWHGMAWHGWVLFPPAAILPSHFPCCVTCLHPKHITCPCIVCAAKHAPISIHGTVSLCHPSIISIPFSEG